MDGLQGVARELAAVIGKDKVSTVPEDLALYSYDCSTYSRKPDVVVRVERKEDVVYILDIAERYGVPVVPRGNATNNCGAVIPVDGGIVLDFVGMNRIIEIDTENFVVVCEPGVITAELQARVEEAGLFYPPDPSGLNMSTIGGNVALNAGGPRAVKYGVTRDYVLGLEVVLPGGHILRTGGKYVKDSSGYNLTQLLVGSEGTLGVFTEIILQLVPLPETRKTILCAYDRVEEAASTVVEILRKRIVPSAMEFLDRVSVGLIQHYMDAGYPRDAESVLLVELDGSTAEVERQIQEVANVARTCGARETRIAGTVEEEHAIWAGRRAGFAALAAYKSVVIPEDATVPRSYLPEMIRKIPVLVTETLLNVVKEPVAIMLFMNIVLLFLGCFLETQAVILLITPIFLPLALRIGLDPIHLGILMVVNTSVGMITPPMAVNLFVASTVSGLSIEAISKRILVFLFLEIAGLLLISYIPPISLWLPSMLIK